ncbi:hypothetical protein ACJX0J_030577, partial [Zea mays]
MRSKNNVLDVLFRDAAVWEFHVPPRQAMQILHFQIGFATFIARVSSFHISINEERCYGLLDIWLILWIQAFTSLSYLLIYDIFLHNTLHANHLSVFVVVWCIMLWKNIQVEYTLIIISYELFVDLATFCFVDSSNPTFHMFLLIDLELQEHMFSEGPWGRIFAFRHAKPKEISSLPSRLNIWTKSWTESKVAARVAFGHLAVSLSIIVFIICALLVSLSETRWYDDYMLVDDDV